MNLLSLYLDQFKRGWSFTAVYLLRDRVDEAGNQKFGFYQPDYTPRKAAVYLHNLTTILADNGAGSRSQSGRLDYSVLPDPENVHDMLLQKSDGTFDLLVWGEQVKGTNQVTVRFGKTFGTVAIYDPTLGTSPVEEHDHISTLSLTLSDHPLIIEIPGEAGAKRWTMTASDSPFGFFPICDRRCDSQKCANSFRWALNVKC